MTLQKKAAQLRIDIIEELYKAQSGHPGGSLSCIDELVALYYNVMNVDPADPQMPDRDRFVLSKGHCCPALYAVLADKGFFPKEELMTLRQLGSHLQGHPDKNKTPGVDACTGSLGQGMSIAVGMATAASAIRCTPWSATASARKVRYGRPQWPPPIISSITSPLFSTITACR